MPITGIAIVECDKCGETIDDIEMTEMCGFYPLFQVDSTTDERLEDWEILDSTQLCPDCKDEEEN